MDQHLAAAEDPLESRIWLVRGKRVMLDVDLALLYGVATRNLNQQVKRNATRFPEGYAFQLTGAELERIIDLKPQRSAPKRGQNIKHRPWAFTEHGAVMLASVLNSPQAVQASLRIVEAFVRLRELIAQRDGLGRIFDVIEDLLGPAAGPKKRIGFQP